MVLAVHGRVQAHYGRFSDRLHTQTRRVGTGGADGAPVLGHMPSPLSTQFSGII